MSRRYVGRMQEPIAASPSLLDPDTDGLTGSTVEERRNGRPQEARYVLTLQGHPGATLRALRALLKRLARDYGVACKGIAQAEGGADVRRL